MDSSNNNPLNSAVGDSKLMNKTTSSAAVRARSSSKKSRTGFVRHKPAEGAGGGRFYSYDFPASKKNEERPVGFATVLEDIRDIEQMQDASSRRFSMIVSLRASDGSSRQKRISGMKGFKASEVLTEIENRYKGDLEAWIHSYLQFTYEGIVGNIVGIQMCTFIPADSSKARLPQATSSRRGFWGQFRKPRS